MKMDDSEHICPLCCEELDISDREFYPCKCGYQVCMWCWHRIRESETGLCPACRTPYGEDPHQFTALDVEEVLKANKEAQAVAKRERYNLQQAQNQMVTIVPTISLSAANTAAINNINAAAAVAAAAAAAAVSEPTLPVPTIAEYDHFSTTTMEMPKDRTQLANMRVIRRNLIYAVGLPPAIAIEDVLRKPEYFGQYGKIAKIVLNRSQTTPAEGGDPRRASASAYVTFQHKEDTLACILVLDGFYLENRNIRASYGTSKYCSAFIKNVRCNNPECTYLHEMGATEDTFTKQEIQAGYVTSGRDVLARQQQIVAEQLQQQLLSATGGTHLPPRKRIGGGGPSGTGKASANPIFPPPEFDEPLRLMLPAPTGITRAVTTQANATPAAQTTAVPVKAGRAISVGAAPSGKSPVLGSVIPIKQPQTGPGIAVAAPTTAASVVAGGRTLSKEGTDSQQQMHSTLTPLTPLKRTSVKAGVISKPPAAEEKAAPARNGKKQNGARAAAAAVGMVKAPSAAPASSIDDSAGLMSLIGGDVIGPPLSSIGSSSAIGLPRFSHTSSNHVSAGSLAELGGDPIDIPSASLTPNRSSAASLLGGEIFHGPLLGQSNSSSASIVGGSSFLNGSSFMPTVDASSTAIGDNALPLRGVSSSSTFWSGDAAPGPTPHSGVIGSHISAKNNGGASSALASILGINLPTGSGSLQESTSFWSSTPLAPTPPLQTPSPLSALNRNAVQQPHRHQGVAANMTRTVGPPQQQPISHNGTSVIGGVPIGGRGSNFGMASEGNQSDIALLQSLLPGVHITTDTNAMGFGPGVGGWSAAPGHHGAVNVNPGMVGGGNHMMPAGNWVGGGGGRMPVPGGGSSVGAIGQGHGHGHGQQNQNQGPGIW